MNSFMRSLIGPAALSVVMLLLGIIILIKERTFNSSTMIPILAGIYFLGSTIARYLRFKDTESVAIEAKLISADKKGKIHPQTSYYFEADEGEKEITLVGKPAVYDLRGKELIENHTYRLEYLVNKDGSLFEQPYAISHIDGVVDK